MILSFALCRAACTGIVMAVYMEPVRISVRCEISVLKPKLGLGLASDPNVNPVKSAAIPHRLRQLVIVTIILGSSNEQLGADKGRTSHVARRQINLPDNLPGRVDAKNLSITVNGAPDTALDVY